MANFVMLANDNGGYIVEGYQGGNKLNWLLVLTISILLLLLNLMGCFYKFIKNRL
jgi:hypothetical protein